MSKRYLFGKIENSRFIYLILVLILIIVIVDMALADALTMTNISNNVYIFYFIASWISYIVLNLIITNNLLNEYTLLGKRIDKLTYFSIMTIIAGSLGLISYQVLNLNYNIDLLMIASIIPYIFSLVYFAALSYKLISFYFYKNNFGIMLFGISSIIVVIFMATSSFYFIQVMSSLDQLRNPLAVMTVEFYDPSSTLGKFQYSYATLSFITSLFFWESSLLLLIRFKDRIKPIKFYFLIVLPLVLIILQPLVIAPIFYGMSEFENSIEFIVISNILPGIIVGTIYGLPFLMIRRNVYKNKKLSNFLLFTGMGFIIWILGNNMSVENGPFPPFGIISVISLIQSSIFIIYGILCFVKYVSEDDYLRTFLKKTLDKDFSMFLAMSDAEVEIEIDKRANSALKLIPNNIVKSGEIDENEIKEYIYEILEEIKPQK